MARALIRRGTCSIRTDVLDSLYINSAYTLGYYSADGNIRGNRVSILSKDYSLIQNVHSFFDIQGTHAIQTVRIPNVTNTYYSLTFSNATIADRFKYYGVHERKSLTNYISDTVKTSSFARDFLRGLFDGDGCIYFDPSVRGNRVEFIITAGSKRVLEDAKEIMINHGGLVSDTIRIIQRKIKTGFRYDLHVYQLDANMKLYNLLYSHLTLLDHRLERKQTKFQQGLAHCLSKRFFDPFLKKYIPKHSDHLVWGISADVLASVVKSSRSLPEFIATLKLTNGSPKAQIYRRVIQYHKLDTSHWQKK